MRATLLSAFLSFAAADVLESTGCDLQIDGNCAAELLQVQANKHVHTAEADAEEDDWDLTEEEDLADNEENAEPARFCRNGRRTTRLSNADTSGTCCARRCGRCGGAGCASRPGGRHRCCAAAIQDNGNVCAGPNDSSCVIPRVNNDEHRRRRTGGGIIEEPPTPLPKAIATVDPHPAPSISPEIVEELGLCSPDAVDTTKSTVLHSNLGGAGPDGGEASLIFGNVKPGVNLKVVATSTYQPNVLNANGGVLRNGLHNGFGRINLASDATVDLTFSFIDATSGAEVAMEPFVMTFVDLDNGGVIGSSETIAVRGFASYQISENTDVTATTSPGGASFTSVLRGGKSDNPEFPTSMTPLQRRKAFGILFEEASSFLVTLRESGYSNPQGRNIFFAGVSALVCGNRAKCSSHSCRAGAITPNAEFTLCAGEPCSPEDDAVCCVQEPVRPCCRAFTPQCLACTQALSVEAWCAANPDSPAAGGCPSAATTTTTRYVYVYPSTTTPDYGAYGPGSGGGYGPPPGYGGYGPGSYGGWR